MSHWFKAWKHEFNANACLENMVDVMVAKDVLQLSTKHHSIPWNYITDSDTSKCLSYVVTRMLTFLCHFQNEAMYPK